MVGFVVFTMTGISEMKRVNILAKPAPHAKRLRASDVCMKITRAIIAGVTGRVVDVTVFLL